MRAGGIKIVALCALTLLGFSALVQADLGRLITKPGEKSELALCTRFLAEAVRVPEDPTEEFKRRIGFLLENGKIEDDHLIRIVESDVPVNPFKSDKHLTTGILPHEKALTRLVRKSVLDWEEVRRFVTNLRAELNRSLGRREVPEKETEHIFVPRVVKTIRTAGPVESAAAFFVDHGTTYAVVGSGDDHVYVIKVPSGDVVHKIETGGVVSSSTALFNENGKTYAIVGSGDGYTYIIDPLKGAIVKDIRTRENSDMKPRGAAAVFKEKGTVYAVIGTGADVAGVTGGSIYVIKPLSGQIVKRIKISGGVYAAPVVIREAGVTYVTVTGREGPAYLIDPLRGEILCQIDGKELPVSKSQFGPGKLRYAVVSGGGYRVYVIRIPSGDVVHSIEVGTWVRGSPTLFREGDTTYAIAVAGSGDVYVIHVATGDVVREIEVKAPTSPAAVFQGRFGNHYALVGSGDKCLWVINPLTGEILEKIKLGDAVWSPPKIVEVAGITYAVAGSNDGKINVIQLTGHFPKKKEEK